MDTGPQFEPQIHRLSIVGRMRILPEVMKTGIVFLQGSMMALVAAAAFLDFGRFTGGGATLVAGAILEILGFALCLISVLTLRQNLTWHVTPHSQLVTHGIFRWSRNPIYVGALLMACGWALMFHSWLCAIAALCLAIILNVKIRLEEGELRRKFGDNYLRYQSQTGRWISYSPMSSTSERSSSSV
jgi:protein-S-isoprenylcysteine O-methyltransferase Ste14